MKILLTGASSFTGFWFVQSLFQAGHEVFCPATGAASAYEGIRRMRAEILRPKCNWINDAPFGSDAFLTLLKSQRFDLLCHHGAEVANYKSGNFDVHKAVALNTLNLPKVLQTAKSTSVKAVILTGTFFENDEGAGEDQRRAFSPYGLSKGLTWQIFRYYCEREGVPLGKFVIPNPFGPYEDERFTYYLMEKWESKQIADVKTPEYFRDNIPVELLARVYASFAEQTASMPKPLSRIDPSGYVETQGAFAQRVAKEVRARTDWPCMLNLNPQTEFSEPRRRFNQTRAASIEAGWNEKAAWDRFVAYYVGHLACR